MEISEYKMSRRAVLPVLIGGASGAALIGGTTGVRWLRAEPVADRGPPAMRLLRGVCGLFTP
jgi:hypothetical protein